MDDFCREKGIRRKDSVARTPQQNGVAERRNMTLIEAARTILGKFVGKSDEVAAGTITNESASTQGELNAGTSTQKEEISQDCIVMPIWKDASYFDSPSKNEVGNDDPKSAVGDPKQDEEGPNNEEDSSSKEDNTANQQVNTASSGINTSFLELNIVGSSVKTTTPEDRI
ncbi:putative ribonuclease H-like domain-containing protein [Tanacetum coccineum]